MLYAGLSASHLRLLARSGRIEAQKLGRDWFTTEAAVLAYLADEALRKKDPYKRIDRVIADDYR